MAIKIQPVSGFPELLPEAQIVFNQIIDQIRTQYELFGFAPLETPAVERVETLLAKGGDDKEIYGLRRLAAAEGEEDSKDLALRFDLTVPLARYVAQHFGQLTFPFRRYQIQPVWRGERPQAGRYRQFYQCDIDVIGHESLGLMHDAEMPAIISGILRGLKVGPFTIRMNNRKVLQGFLTAIGLETAASVAEALRIVDRMEKVPAAKTEADLKTLGLGDNAVGELLAFFRLSGSTADILAALKQKTLNETYAQGVAELETVTTAMKQLGVADEEFTIDPTIARGLDYYTGTIYETRLHDHPGLGSVCSGGRYDNLAGQFSNQKLPGVGISIGISRLVVPLMEQGVFGKTRATTADVLVTAQNPDLMPYYLSLAAKLRGAGIKTEVFMDVKKLGKQMQYAAKKGFKYALIADQTEADAGEAIVRNLESGEQHNHKLDSLIKALAL